MSWSSRLGILALVAALAPACRIEVGGAEEAAITAAPDTLRFYCANGPRLAAEASLPLALPVERLLPSADDLLAVTTGGELVLLPDGTGRPRELLSNGKDYDILDGVVARLAREEVDFFRYERGRLRALADPVAVESHETSLALGRTAVHLHSPADPSNVLVTARDRRTGERTAGHLPVERSFLRLLMTDPDALLVETGRVRSSGDRLAFVPTIRDPVVVFGEPPLALFLGDGARGILRTVERTETLAERPCPTCTEHRETTTRQEVRPLYADAAMTDPALWVLRLTPPGSARATLLRVGMERPGRPEVHSWRLDGLDATPAALALWRGRIVVADGRHLHVYPIPALQGGVPCASR